jgi:hypothetical protein
VGSVVEDVPFEIGSDRCVFLPSFGTRVGCGGRVEDVHCRSGVLGDVVGFHGALQSHLIPVNLVYCYANRPVIVCRVGSLCIGHRGAGSRRDLM